ncbi:MAG: anti-sigma factor family protein [bacterium]
MRCRKARALFSLYIDGALPPNKKEDLEAHIKQCSKCKNDLEDMLAIHESFRLVEHFKAPEGFATRVMAHIEERNLKGLSLFPVLTGVIEIGVIILTIIIGTRIGGIIGTAMTNPQQSITKTLSLETFDSIQPHSIGAAYIAMVEDNNEK